MIIKKILPLIKNKLIKESGWSFATKGITFLLFYSIHIILTRFLGLEKFGQWSFFFSIITVYTTISYGGINLSSQKFVAQFNKTTNLSEVISQSLSLRILLSLFFSVLLLLIHRPLGIFFNINTSLVIFLAAIPFVFFSGLVEFLKDVFVGLHRNIYNFAINTIDYGTKLFLIVMFLVYFFSEKNFLSGLIISFGLSLGLASVLGIWFINKYVSRIKLSLNGKFIKQITKYSLPLLIINIGFMAITEVNTLMLGLLSSNEQVGLYATASLFINKFSHISQALSMGIMPIFAQLNPQNLTRLKKIFYKLIKYHILIYGSLMLTIFAASGHIINLLFGESYSSAAVPLRLLVLFSFMHSISIYISAFLNYQGLAHIRARNLLITIIGNITFNFILIPKYGAIGAAISTSLTYIPYIILNWLEVKKIWTSPQIASQITNYKNE